jgi:hypothetical protein
MSVNILSTNGRERLPIIPYSGHCSRALNFYEMSDTLYFGLGKTTPWSEDETESSFIPPEPDIDATNLMELVGLKQATRVMLVIPSDDGEIEYRGSTWKSISTDEAIENNARWVLVETTIYYDEMPITDYRQIGIFSRVQRADGLEESQTVLLAERGDIKDFGILEVLDNRHVVTRQSDTKDVYQMIIEF